MLISRFARPARTAAASMILALATTAAWPAATSALLVGSVSSTAISAPIVVVALDRRAGKIVHRTFLETQRGFRMAVAPGSYKLYAFADANRNGVREPTEAVSVMYAIASPLRAGEELELPVLAIGK
jgi:phosphate/sulfate permease